RKLQLRLRGIRFRATEASQVPARDLLRVDTCWSAVAGLSLVDTVRAAYFQTRGLLLALDAGEPFRIVRALASEAVTVAFSGRKGEKRAAYLLQSADQLAQQVADPHAVGTVSVCKGCVAYFEGRWQTALELCDQAERVFLDRCTGVA